jgi:NADH:ubiquinone oxidoreductase subunit F (NADH-binding)
MNLHATMSRYRDAEPRRDVQLSRLTVGWQDASGAATLREHVAIYGLIPDVGSQEQLIEEVTAAGLTGRGGAGFPTGVKMRTVASKRGPAVVVANGMESEPASEKDQALLARAPHLVLDGIALAAEAVSAREAHLCIARTRDWLIDIVMAAVEERRRADVDPVPVIMHEVPHHYVSSEETSLVQWLNGGEAKPAYTPPRPFERGVGKRPTLIDNVETLAHIALIARYGARWFREAGYGNAAGTTLTTVSGAVAQPGVYEIAAGSELGDVLAMAGADPAAEAVLIGGYFGTWHEISEVAHLPFTTSGLRSVSGSPGAGVLYVLPPDSCGIVEAARILRYLASQSAQQCGPCMFGLPAIADDLSQLASMRLEGDPLGRMQRRFGQIAGRGACRHPDGAVRMAASALRAFGQEAHAHARRRACLASPRGRQKQIMHVPRPIAAEEWR